jgi:hypothetical protein
VLLVLATVLVALWREAGDRLLLFVLAAASLGLVLAMLRIQAATGGPWLWIGSAGVIVALVAAVLIVPGRPRGRVRGCCRRDRRRARRRVRRVSSALPLRPGSGGAGRERGRRHSRRSGPRRSAPGAAAATSERRARGVRWPRSTPWPISGDASTRAFLAGLVMIVAGGIALYQRTAQP